MTRKALKVISHFFLWWRHPSEINYRALRDMGLAAWWGSSLMGRAGLRSASNTQADPVERLRVLDAGWAGTQRFHLVAISAYLTGGGLVRFKGKPFGRYGVPRWATEGVESIPRTAATAGAIVSMIAAAYLRRAALKTYEQEGRQGASKAEQLLRIAMGLHALVPTVIGYLMVSHLEQDMREMAGRRQAIRRPDSVGKAA